MKEEIEENKKGLQVLFLKAQDKKIIPSAGQVIIVPDNTTWNDFGYKIRCNYKVCIDENVTPLEGNFFIGFLSSKENNGNEKVEVDDDGYSISEILRDRVDSSVNANELPPFFTLQPNMNSYREIVSLFNVKNAALFLSGINDLVYHKEEKSEWISDAVSTDVFRLGFMRNSEPFFAFHNAASLLGGVEFENFSAISNALDLSFRLEGYANEHEIKFRFNNRKENLIPKRINILIGNNGIGKSLALKQFCRGALQYKDTKTKLVDSSHQSRRPMINRLLAIGTPGETNNTFPAERIGTQKLYYRRLNLSRNSSLGLSRGVGDSLVQLARNVEAVGEKSRWEIFWKAIEKVLPVNNLFICLKEGNETGKRYASLNRLDYPGGEQSSLEFWSKVDSNSEPRVEVNSNYYPLSSGQLTFFKFALLCSLHIENGSFVLMDEPETHLHPNFIADFVELLDFILENTGSQAIIATHSAYFVKEVTRSQVHVFKDDGDRGISIIHPRLRTFGSDVDSISQFVFDENTESRLTDKIYKKVKDRDFESVDEELRGEISLAALMDLRRRMEE